MGIVRNKIVKNILVFTLCFVVSYAFFVTIDAGLQSKKASEIDRETEELVNVTDLQKEENKSIGTYSYIGLGTGYKGKVKTEVTITDGKIVEILILENVDDEDYFLGAKEQVVEAIIGSQSTEVDVVSGATYSSKGIITSVADALSKAGI